jgi:serine/threonine protein kinase
VLAGSAWNRYSARRDGNGLPSSRGCVRSARRAEASRPAELAGDELFRRRFLRETELAASLHHPNIVPTLALDEENGSLYLAMANVEGEDLGKLLRREDRLEPERALELP